MDNEILELWLLWAIIPCSPNMVTVRICSKLKTSSKSVVFTNKVGKNSRYFVDVFNKTIIPLTLVGYEMIIANQKLIRGWHWANSYPMCTRGIIVNNFFTWVNVLQLHTQRKLLSTQGKISKPQSRTPNLGPTTLVPVFLPSSVVL